MLLDTHWHLFSLSLISLFFVLWTAEVSIFTIVMASNRFFIKSRFIVIEPHWSSLGLMNEWWKFWWVNKNLCQVIQLVSPWRNCVYDLQASNTLKTRKEKHFISRWNVIVCISVAPDRIVVDSDWRFDNLWGSHLQNQSELYHVSWWYLFFLPLWGIRNYLSKKTEIRGRDNWRTWEGHKRDSRRTQGTQEGHHRVQGVH